MNFLKILSDIRTQGMKITLTNKYGKMDRAVLISVLLHLLSKGTVVLKEVKTNDAVVEMVVATKVEVLDSYECEDFEIYTYENKEELIDEMFAKLNLSDAYAAYKKKWMLEQSHGDHNDVENIKRAKDLLRWMKPVVDEKGHLFLTEDGAGNTVWAFTMANKNSGTIRYGIYMKNAAGRPTQSQFIQPAVANEMGTKLSNLIKNYNGKFLSQDATEATMKLWCWNLAKKYEVQYELDDYDQQDIFEILKYWIVENAGCVFKEGENTFEPIYLAKIKDRTDVGIWNDSLQFVFDLLDIEEQPKCWLQEAVKEKWVIPQLNGKGEIVRIAMNTSSYQREIFNRKNRHERYYRFSLDDEEIKEAVENYQRNKAIENSQIMCID